MKCHTVKIPAGEFTMGSNKTYGASAPRRISTDAFLIDRFPLTNAQYRGFIEDGGYQRREYWSKKGWNWKEREEVSKPLFLDDPKLTVLSAPVVGISWYEAEAYASWVGKRLPTEEEWERAARGDRDAREYPWGDEFDPSKCNMREKGTGQPTPVGSYPGGVSPHGCYDMSGNVWEWTKSLYQEGIQYRVVRGGSWVNDRGSVRCTSRNDAHPGYGYSNVGVRLCRTSF